MSDVATSFYVVFFSDVSDASPVYLPELVRSAVSDPPRSQCDCRMHTVSLLEA